VTRLDLLQTVSELCKDFPKVTAVVVGGKDRVESTHLGLNALSDKVKLAAIHDGARPLVEVEAIERCVAAVRNDPQVDGAICASRGTDTLKVVNADGRVMGSPDRSAFWGAQTPQVFRRTTIVRAHEWALLEGFVGTDDASLVEQRGGKVRVIESPRDNIKVTVPEDLAIAEATLRSRMGMEYWG
jgi:2-C-methyl-D-erythritol 4-phosphate cytidylyltransferase